MNQNSETVAVLKKLRRKMRREAVRIENTADAPLFDLGEAHGFLLSCDMIDAEIKRLEKKEKG